MPRFITGARFAAKICIVCFLASLVPVSGYGQDPATEALLLIKEDRRGKSLPNGDSKTRFARFFGPGLRLTHLAAGLTSLTTLDSRFDHPSRVPVTIVSWSAASMNPNTAVPPPTTASLSTHRKKTTTLRVIAGLLGAGLLGVGAYLVSSPEGPNRVEICTLCSEPPASSQVHLQLTGTQGQELARSCWAEGFFSTRSPFDGSTLALKLPFAGAFSQAIDSIAILPFEDRCPRRSHVNSGFLWRAHLGQRGLGRWRKQLRSLG